MEGEAAGDAAEPASALIRPNPRRACGSHCISQWFPPRHARKHIQLISFERRNLRAAYKFHP